MHMHVIYFSQLICVWVKTDIRLSSVKIHDVLDTNAVRNCCFATTNKKTRRLLWIQLLNNLIQLFQSLSGGGFLSWGSLVVKEVWGATNDSMFQVAACSLAGLWYFRSFSFHWRSKKACAWILWFCFLCPLCTHTLLIMFVSLRMKEETDRFIYLTSLFSNVIRWKMKKLKTHQAIEKHF